MSIQFLTQPVLLVPGDIFREELGDFENCVEMQPTSLESLTRAPNRGTYPEWQTLAH